MEPTVKSIFRIKVPYTTTFTRTFFGFGASFRSRDDVVRHVPPDCNAAGTGPFQVAGGRRRGALEHKVLAVTDRRTEALTLLQIGMKFKMRNLCVCA